jgi:superfamily II DNA or RNA helicase
MKKRPWNMQGGKSKSNFIFEKIPLYESIAEGGIFTHAGLLPSLCEALREANVPYTVSDHRAPLPEPVFDGVGALRTYQPEVLATICSSHMGVVDCATGMGKTYMIEQLCRIYPTLKILVVSGSRPVVNSIYDRICRSCPTTKVSKHSGSHRFIEESAVCVSTVGVLYKIPPEWPDLLIYDEAHEAGSARAVTAVLSFSNCRRFGFSASPTGRSDRADKFVEALFGPTIAEVGYQDAEAAGLVVPIECRMVAVPGPRPLAASSAIGKKKEGYWQNTWRNDLIARSAKAFDNEQVLIFVEKTEHALRLKQRLPEYEVVHGGVSDMYWQTFVHLGIVDPDQLGLKSPDADDIRKRFEAGTLRKAICTTCWNKGVDFPELSVLIRGDGQTSSIPCTQIVGRLARTTDDKPRGILVDFQDNFDPWCIRRSNKRKNEYEKKGWRIREGWVPPYPVP